MADTTTTEPTTDTTATTDPAGTDTGAKPADEPLGESGLKALKAEREARAAAEKQAQELAAKVKEYEDAQKTEEQKAQERLTAAEQRAAELELRALRAEVATTKGVPVNLLNGTTKEELEANADELIAFRGEPQQPSRGLVIPAEGSSPVGHGSSPADQFAAAIAPIIH